MVDQELREVELKRIRPNRLNPRLDINIERLNELAESIKQIGVLEPIILRPADDGYEVVVGERRYRAAQQAGLEAVPAIIREYTDEQVIELNLVENIQREELTAVEKGNCVKQLIEKIEGFVRKHNQEAHPFAWVATADSILEKVGRLCNVISGTAH
jgi:ParB family chromosome partitioning protein